MDACYIPKSKHGYDTWVHCTWEQLSKKAEKAFVAVRNMLLGRKRSNRRTQFRGFMAKLEKERKEGRIRKGGDNADRSKLEGWLCNGQCGTSRGHCDGPSGGGIYPDGSL